MLRFLIVAGFLCGFFSTQADARTIRYEFDVVNSYFNVSGYLEEYDSPFASGIFLRTVPSSDPFYQEIVDSIHPLSNIAGQTGRVVIQVGGGGYVIQCLTGILCPYIENYATISSHDLNEFILFQNFGHWYLNLVDPLTGKGRLGFTDDRTFGFGWLNGKRYGHGGAYAEFSLANLTITEIAPVPLPATAPLLAFGLAALGIGARRRSHRA